MLTRQEVVAEFRKGFSSGTMRAMRNHPGLWEDEWREFVAILRREEIIVPELISQLKEAPTC